MSHAADPTAWLLAADRVYGPLADALGLRPLRAFGQAWCELAAAQVAESVAGARLGAVVAAGALDGWGRLQRRLAQPETEVPATPTALLRLGLGAFDGAMHAAMLSEPGLAATAATVRASSRRRLGWQKLAALGAEAAGQPTRDEVDQAWREIQQLKRELRALKRAAAGRAGAKS